MYGRGTPGADREGKRWLRGVLQQPTETLPDREVEDSWGSAVRQHHRNRQRRDCFPAEQPPGTKRINPTGQIIGGDP